MMRDEITIRAQKDNSLIIDGLAYLEDVEEELMQILGIQSLKH